MLAVGADDVVPSTGHIAAGLPGRHAGACAPEGGSSTGLDTHLSLHSGGGMFRDPLPLAGRGTPLL